MASGNRLQLGTSTLFIRFPRDFEGFGPFFSPPPFSKQSFLNPCERTGGFAALWGFSARVYSVRDALLIPYRVWGDYRCAGRLERPTAR